MLLINCSNKIALGPKCTKVSESGSYEKSIIWFRSSLISEKEFERKVSTDNCPKKTKVAKKS